MSNLQILARGYRRNEASINARWVDFPAPVGPIIKVCPTSSACRLKRNGVWPLVFASSNGGLLGGEKGHGLEASPGQTAVVGSRCARFSVCRIGRRTFS